MADEIIRKMIHLVSLSIPIGYYYLSYGTTMKILLPLTAIAVIVDYGKFYISWLNRFYLWLVGPILRQHERDASKKLLSGGSFVFISAVFCIAVFPKIIAVTAFSILIISDASSAIFGRMFGKHHFLDKSLEGAIAFILSAWIVILVTPKVSGLWAEYAMGFFAAIVGAIIESASVSLRTDDNFTVPISIGAILWAGYFLLSMVKPSVYGAMYDALVS